MVRKGIKRLTSLVVITSMLACGFTSAALPVQAQTAADTQPVVTQAEGNETASLL